MHPIKKHPVKNQSAPTQETNGKEQAEHKKRKKEHDKEIHHDPDLHGYSKAPTILPTDKRNKPL